MDTLLEPGQQSETSFAAASSSSSSSSPPSASSSAIRRALEQIEHATRLLCGDSRPLLDNLISSSGTATGAGGSMNAATAVAMAAAIAPVGVSNFDGGLSQALPSLLAPLLPLPSGSTASSTAEALYLVRQASFQPRRCLACAQELRMLFSGDGRGAVDGQASALLAVMMAADVRGKWQGSTSGASNHDGRRLAKFLADSSLRNADRLLEQRNGRRQRSGQASVADMDADQGSWGRVLSDYDDSNTARPGVKDGRERNWVNGGLQGSNGNDDSNPLRGNAFAVALRFAERVRERRAESDLADQSSSAARTPDPATQQQDLTLLLSEWQKALSSMDAEASASLSVSLRWCSSHVARVRLDIDQVGSVIVWLQWTFPKADVAGESEGDVRRSYNARIERINVLAEAESNLHSNTKARGAATGQNDDEAIRLSAPSSFPLYRQLASQLLAGALQHAPGEAPARSAATETQGPSSSEGDLILGSDDSLVALLACLFASTRLCRLHDPLHSLGLHPAEQQLPSRTLEASINSNA